LWCLSPSDFKLNAFLEPRTDAGLLGPACEAPFFEKGFKFPLLSMFSFSFSNLGRGGFGYTV